MTKNLEIHIVSFTIPYPADYGGVIDVFYKIKSLYESGVTINLHCFKYDRTEAKELNKYCKTVNYYNRPKKLKHFFSTLPFIVITRSDKKILNKLKSDQLPILFEGLHTTYFLNQLLNDNPREIVVRTHNIEHEYYIHLAKNEKTIFNKIFYYSEALKLKRYQKILNSNVKVAGITEKDCHYFKFLNSDTFLINAFHPHNKVNIIQGIGNYILFHGNLSVNENIEAARFILNNICPEINFKFKIAGKNPGKKLYDLAKKYKNAEIIANPSEEEMLELIKNAHINLLITFQDTGIKLKLINALFVGRHCIANNEMVMGTELESICHICNTTDHIIRKIKELINVGFSEQDINKRNEILLKNVNNKLGAQKLINLLD